MVFIVTIVATLLTDLLVGVIVGMVTEYLVSAALGAPLGSLFSSVPRGTVGTDGRMRFSMPAACIFGNVIGFKSRLAEANGSPVTLDFSKVLYVDHTFMHELRTAEKEHDIKIVDLDRLTPMSHHREAARRAEPRRYGLLTVLG
jgi:MFS superfamily sulfate permease-like transporter